MARSIYASTRSGLIEGDTDGEAVPDAELLRAHVAGDPDAFATLVTRHQDRFWTIALRIMRNPEDAADALQDALSRRSGRPAVIEATLR